MYFQPIDFLKNVIFPFKDTEWWPRHYVLDNILSFDDNIDS